MLRRNDPVKEAYMKSNFQYITCGRWMRHQTL